MLDKLVNSVEKELKEIGEQGLNASNLEMTKKLVDMYKDLQEVSQMEGGNYGMRGYGRDGGYGNRGGGYMDRGRYYVEGDYNNRGGYGNRGGGGYNEGRGGGGNYNGYNRMKEHLDRINDGVEMYDYGRERYQHGDSEERVFEGLEKLMYAVCMFVESAMDLAETPQEKDIIRRHVQKMSSM